MLLIIPSIDLTKGHALRCVVGTPGTEQLYSEISDHPVELAQLWRRENAKCLHVTDRDSWDGDLTDINTSIAVEMQQAVDIPLQFISRQPTVSAYRKILERGIYRVALNAVAISEPDATRELIEEYGSSRVVVSIRAHDGDVELGDSGGMIRDEELIRSVYELGCRRVIYTEVDWEGNLTGEDIATVKRVAAVVPMRFTMAGGIASPEHLWMLQDNVPRNVDSLVIGRAMYENRFPCQRIWRSIEAKLEPEIHEHASENPLQSSISKLD